MTLRLLAVVCMLPIILYVVISLFSVPAHLLPAFHGLSMLMIRRPDSVVCIRPQIFPCFSHTLAAECGCCRHYAMDF